MYKQFVKILFFVFVFGSSLASYSEATTTAEKLPRASKPKFSHESGFYPQEFNLVLSHKDPNAVIYYTLDGSEPDPENLNGKTYRYKNEYQQPPINEGEKVVIKNNFLYNEYKTYKYTAPIKIKDRTYEPDRISQISTTFDAKPDYFPKPKVDEKSWINKVVNAVNWFTWKINNQFVKINTFISRGFRKLYTVFTGVIAPLSNRQYIPHIPKITYVAYKKPLQYSFKGTPVRAIAVLPNHRPSKIVTHTLFIGDKDQFSLPIIAITVPEKDLFDYEEGIFVAGKTYDEWISKGQVIPWSTVRPFNWIHNPRTKVEFNFDFPNSGQISFADVRSSGLGTRGLPNKSMKIYPNKKYSKKGFDFSLFEDAKKISLTRIMLRNNVEDGGSHLTDNVFQFAANGLSFTTQNSKQFISILNGEFNGLLTAKYRYDKYFIANLFDLDKNRLDLIKMQWPIAETVAQSGSLSNWKKTLENISNDLDAFAKEFDTESLVDYFATQIYLDNDDWPHNNLRIWRYVDSSFNNPASDGKWRWMMFDVDAVGARETKIFIDRNKLSAVLNGRDTIDSIYVIKKFLSYEGNINKFVLRFSDLLNSNFETKRIVEIIREMEADIEQEMPRHIERWQAPKSMEHWRNSISQMIKFTEERPAIQRQHLQEFFELDGLYTVQVDVSNKAAGTIKLNTLHLGLTDNELEKPVAASARATHMTDVLAFPWAGEYFQNMPLTLEAVAKEGFQFSHWEAQGIELTNEQINSPALSLKPKDSFSIQAVYVKSADASVQ